jgi:hypothetical protein
MLGAIVWRDGVPYFVVGSFGRLWWYEIHYGPHLEDFRPPTVGPARLVHYGGNIYCVAWRDGYPLGHFLPDDAAKRCDVVKDEIV